MRHITTILIILCFYTSFSQQNDIEIDYAAIQAEVKEEWVESTLASLSFDERIGQIFMLRAHSNWSAARENALEQQIIKYKPGGLIFFQGSPLRQAALTNRYQKVSGKVALMIAMDAEWGLGMRLKKSTMSFPRQLSLGAIRDDAMIYEMGREIARQCRRLGVHINFAPVMDVNNNINNPVINNRSFGEDKYNVTAKSYYYMKGLQDGHVMACGKHFPGHGDTDIDSHYDLPRILHDEDRLNNVELYPFRKLAKEGLQSVMVAHLSVPALDSATNRPTTLSRPVITDLLKEDIGYQGLIFTDAMEMKGVAKHFSNGVAEAEALLAGNDVILLPQNMDAAFRTIKRYIAEGRIDSTLINNRARRILAAKYDLRLNKSQHVSLNNLHHDLHTEEAKALYRKLMTNAITLVRNAGEVVPLQLRPNENIATLSIGTNIKSTFQHTLDKYSNFTHYQAAMQMSATNQQRLHRSLKDRDIVIISLHDMKSRARDNYGLSQNVIEFIQQLNTETIVVLSVFGNPYSIKNFDTIDRLLVCYEEDDVTQEVAAQTLVGGIPVDGRLPVTASPKSPYGCGVSTQGFFRFAYDSPAAVGLNTDTLRLIDSLMLRAIQTRATPGGVVLVAKDGKIVYDKAFGYHTYAKRQRVNINDVYDLASITKIAATTIAVMKLHDDGIIDIMKPVSDYLPELKTTNKAHITIYDMMAHLARLQGWLKFYEQTVTPSRRNPRPSTQFYRRKKDRTFSIPVAAQLYMRQDFRDSMKVQIRDSKLRQRSGYKYSDLGFYLLADLVERVTGKKLDAYTKETFYTPLGLRTTTFNPLNKIHKSRIPPSDEDNYFRRQRIQGHVHDMGAAMLGGVSGHAGLFSNATDLAVIMQMLLNGGYYGDHTFFSPNTVHTFTTRHTADTRRGIGFDMKELDSNRSMNMSELASSRAFGHLGFTGTCTWADPEHNLIVVILTNRTFPKMRDYKWSTQNYRPRIQEVVYRAMEK